MLKSLFNRIKSEKSSTIKNDESERDFNTKEKYEFFKLSNLSEVNNWPSVKDQTQLEKKLIQESQCIDSLVKSSIKQVRYWINEDISDIFASVLSCPISHYNLLPHSQRKVKEIDLKKEKFPEYLNFMRPLLQKQLPTFNHLLINHYPRGIGIMHHFDGPMYQDKVVVLSLGGPALISFQENYQRESQSMRILLEDKSIHIFEQDVYQRYLHGIEDNKVDVITFTIFEGIYPQNAETNDMIKIKSNKLLKEGYWIRQSSIRNMNSVKYIHKVIAKNLEKLTFKQETFEQYKYCFEFNEFQGYTKVKGCFIYIRPDQKSELTKNIHETQKNYRWKMEIQRQQRISITIREQYSNQFLG